MDKSLNKRFGLALRALREAAGKTQEDFSISRTYVSELERGLKTPTLETIARLAEELGTTAASVVARAMASSPAPGPSHQLLLPAALHEGIALASAASGADASATFVDTTPLSAIEAAAKAAKVELPRVLAEAALLAFRRAPGTSRRERRQKLQFIVADKRPRDSLQYALDNKTPWCFTPVETLRALQQANTTLELADDVLGMNGIPFYELLGTRNLGSFVGAVYAYSLQRELKDRLMVNRHQDGYPDLCALTTKGKKICRTAQGRGHGDGQEVLGLLPRGWHRGEDDVR